MLSNLVQWLDSVGSIVFWTCVVGLVVVNSVAATAFFSRQSRELVNQWTTRVLAANVILIGAGTAIPAVTYVARIAVTALSPVVTERINNSFEINTPN